jgi:hypothetical protein
MILSHRRKAPIVEKASIDEFYLDITGMDRFHGCYQWTNELSQSITKETGLPLSFILLIRRFQNWNRRIKTNRKIRDSRNHGKTFEPIIQKNSDGW